MSVAEFRGIRLTISYEMTCVATGALVLTGKTVHCFTDMAGKPVILKKKHPGFDAVLRAAAENQG